MEMMAAVLNKIYSQESNESILPYSDKAGFLDVIDDKILAIERMSDMFSALRYVMVVL